MNFYYIWIVYVINKLDSQKKEKKKKKRAMNKLQIIIVYRMN